MKQEDKDLLLKELCCRLPYTVNVEDDMKRIYTLQIGNSYLIDLFYGNGDYVEAPIKPYLRPMSSMTDNEKKELLTYVLGKNGTKYFHIKDDGSIDNNDAANQDLYNSSFHWINFDGDTTSNYLDWLNYHHFDFRNLIERGLAIEAPKDMYKEEKK